MFGLHKFKSLAELEDSFIQYQDKTFSSWCLVNNCPRFYQPIKKVMRNRHNRIVWNWRSNRAEASLINFDFGGAPVMCVGRIFCSCHQGRDKDAKTKEQKKEQYKKLMAKRKVSEPSLKVREIYRSSKKVDCPSKITFIRFIKFPEFKVKPSSTWRQRQKIMKILKERLFDKKKVVKAEEEYYALYPSLDSHKGHTMGPMPAKTSISIRKRLVLKSEEHDDDPHDFSVIEYAS